MIELRVLVVEDVAKVAAIIKRGLEEETFAVDTVDSGEDALWMATEQTYDAVVLDVLLPDMDGFAVCHRLRQQNNWVPILMLTALDAVEDRVRGLDVGADDYLTKPFAFNELVARLRALLRRGVRPRPAVLVLGDLSLDPATREVSRGGQAVALTAKEFALLEYFMRHAGDVLSRSRLIEHVWDFAFDGDPNVVSVYVGYLRDKIDRPFGCHSLQTVRGTGYRLRENGNAATPD